MVSVLGFGCELRAYLWLINPCKIYLLIGGRNSLRSRDIEWILSMRWEWASSGVDSNFHFEFLVLGQGVIRPRSGPCALLWMNQAFPKFDYSSTDQYEIQAGGGPIRLIRPFHPRFSYHLSSYPPLPAPSHLPASNPPHPKCVKSPLNHLPSPLRPIALPTMKWTKHREPAFIKYLNK